ncbi:hypothetical protein C8R43DRAFT_886703 [Mycena crocata]|nr:hypothetical protein C8R43DRAFT_886703 [Mycena crocata]
MLLHEAALYARLRSLQGRGLPRMFGLFAGRGLTVLVLTHRGAPLAQMHELGGSQRTALYDALRALHQRGVAHGDLRADNVVVSEDGVPSLIDLSHAWVHRCLGPSGCEELRQARSFFLLRD